VFNSGAGPIVAAAIHAGHDLPLPVSHLLAIDGESRTHEEDSYTDAWTTLAHRRIVVHRSRFHVDLNRPRDRAVYRNPMDAWGLDVWKEPLPQKDYEEALELHRAFYVELARFLDGALEDHRKLVVLDLHSYNHKRNGPDAPAAETVLNPEINIGLGSVNMERWGTVVRRFLQDLKAFERPCGHTLDVRANVKFRGGHFPNWINRRYPRSVCAIAVEVKKTFMDEWSGELHPQKFAVIHDALRSTVPGLITALGD